MGYPNRAPQRHLQLEEILLLITILHERSVRNALPWYRCPQAGGRIFPCLFSLLVRHSNCVCKASLPNSASATSTITVLTAHVRLLLRLICDIPNQRKRWDRAHTRFKALKNEYLSEWESDSSTSLGGGVRGNKAFGQAGSTRCRSPSSPTTNHTFFSVAYSFCA